MPQQTPRLNLTLPDTGNKTWETDVENWAHKLDASSAQYLNLHLGGQAIDEEIIFDGFHFDEAVQISGITLFARVAPAGSDLVIDFLKNQLEQSQTVSLPAGSQSGSGSVTGLTYTPLEAMGLKVKGVGSTEPGAEISLLIHYHIQPIV